MELWQHQRFSAGKTLCGGQATERANGQITCSVGGVNTADKEDLATVWPTLNGNVWRDLDTIRSDVAWCPPEYSDSRDFLKPRSDASSLERLLPLQLPSAPPDRGRDDGEKDGGHVSAEDVEEKDERSRSQTKETDSSTVMPLVECAVLTSSRQVETEEVVVGNMPTDGEDLPTEEEIRTQYSRLTDSWHGLSTERCWRIMATMGEMGHDPYPPLEETFAALHVFLSCWSAFHDRKEEIVGMECRFLSEAAFLALVLNEQMSMSLPTESFRALTQLRRGMLAELRFHNAQVASGSYIKNPFDEESSITDQRIDQISALVIACNALVLGMSADTMPTHELWDYCEYVFVAYFIGEVVLKVFLHGPYTFVFGDQRLWNFFDVLVVLVAVFDGIVSFSFLATAVPDDGLESFTTVKVLRLTRLARLVRLLRYKLFEDLKSMIQGVIAGIRVLAWAIFLFLFIVYVIAVCCRKTVGMSRDHEYSSHHAFETVPTAMFTLFRCFTSGCSAYDGTPLEIHLAKRYGIIFMGCYVLVVLSVTIGVSNLIMAIFIDNVMTASIARKQAERGRTTAGMEWKLQTLTLKLFEQTGRRKRRSMQGSGDQTITREIFQVWLQNEEMINLLSELDIPVSDKNAIFDVLDIDLSGELQVEEVVEGLMKLRGCSDKLDTVATVMGIRYLTRVVEELSGKVGTLKRSIADDDKRSSTNSDLQGHKNERW
eukprot:TRINITY_DN15373_c0_g3_i2.p1 TRINITY_DN15373_c0_g3~~TRINITY_DN15373_c0_g3_i2.p1  ORF type:complete len:739 (-),score=131.91 TRINITY_DN15373_c0_g3_i2:9-2147(-)